ncbi:MAG: SDR family NAD(P)-dependent oxidoreductase [Candidatus Hermodarchaeota archaeon]
MEKKVILITGSTDGIGHQAAIELANLGHHIIVHGRNQEKSKEAMKKIARLTNNNNLNFAYADLGVLEQIRTMANTIYENYDKLDVLINNAGVIRQERTINQDGLEETFAINYVAPFFLTNLLLDLLKEGTSSRIVNVVSRVHSNQFNFEDLQFEKGYTAVKAYAKSKTALILFTYFLAEKSKVEGITVNCLHPGAINTKLFKAVNRKEGASVQIGAKTLVYAATAYELEGISGKYLVNNRFAPSKEITYDKGVQTTLWRKTEEIIKNAPDIHQHPEPI